MKNNSVSTAAGSNPPPLKSRGWLGLAAVLGTSAFAGPAPLPPIEVSGQQVTAALAEGVALSLRETPADERGLVMIGTGLNEALIISIQQSSGASRVFVERIASRYSLSAETKIYMIGALIGLSEICRDFPPPRADAMNPCVLKLIIAFRHGVRAGVEIHLTSLRPDPTVRSQPTSRAPAGA